MRKNEDYILIDDSEMYIDLDADGMPDGRAEAPDWFANYLNLARELLKASLAENRQSNVVVSPFSLYVMLVLAMNATAGKSQKEIKEVLADGYAVKNLTEQVQKMQRDFCQQMKGGRLASSNGICLDESVYDKILPEFGNSIQKELGAEIFSGGDQAVDKINEWVSQKTEGMIEKLLDDLPTSFKACLMNAIAFRAKWQKPYDEYDIGEGYDFTNADGSVSEVTMLCSKEQGYIEDEFFTGFVKPYKGGKYDLMCLLPNKKKSQTFLGRALENIDFKKYYDSLNISQETNVMMPEFECFTDSELKSLCQKLGINDIFTPKASFSGMLTKEAGPVMVDSAIQKAYVKVNREGTKAAAVSAMVVCVGCAPDFDRVKEVTLDRPFIYAIMNKQYGLPVFVGMVNQL